MEGLWINDRDKQKKLRVLIIFLENCKFFIIQNFFDLEKLENCVRRGFI